MNNFPPFKKFTLIKESESIASTNTIMNKEAKSPEELLDKHNIRLSSEVYKQKYIDAMREYAAQFQSSMPSEEDIIEIAFDMGHGVDINSQKYAQSEHDAFISGFKKALSLQQSEAVEFLKWFSENAEKEKMGFYYNERSFWTVEELYNEFKARK